MKILIAAGIFPPDIGGPAVYTERLANELKKKGIEVEVIAYSDENNSLDNFPVTRIPRSNILPIRYFLYFIKLLSLAKKSDIIYAQDLFSSGLPAVLAKKILKKKLIIRLGGDFLWEKAIEKGWSEKPLSQYYQQPKNYQEKLFFWLSQRTLKAAGLIIFSTDWQKKIYLKNYKIRQEKTAVIQNPFPEEELIIGQEDSQKIIFAGRLIKLKNIDFLIEAFNQVLIQHKNLRLEIIGQGPQKEHLKNIVSQNQLEKNVVFRGRLPRRKLLKEISQSFLVILPSFSEISPNLVLECIKLKKPVLLTKETGFYERFKDNLIFIDPFNKEDLIDKINYLLDKENYIKYQKQISLISTDYSWTKAVREHLNIFNGLRALMIGTDRTWFGVDYSGDLIKRHQEYVQQLEQFGSSYNRLDIIVFSKKGFNERKFGDNLRVYPTNSLFKIFYIWDAYRIGLKHREFDLIVAQDPFLAGLVGWILKRKFKIPLLIHFHGDFWDNLYWLKEKWQINLLFLIISKYLVKKADGIRVVSSGIKEKIIRAGINEEKVRVIPTPFNLEKPDFQKIANLKEIYKDRKIIINVGRLDPSKDYETLLRAIGLVYEKYKNIAFWQIGANLNLSEKIMNDGNLILFSSGKIDQKELADYYYASDIYVSSSSHESFGKVLVEAMAAGLPIVATKTTGSKEIVIDGENGFLTSIGDSQALAKKILYLLNNRERAKEMGEAGRKIAKVRFDRQKNIQKIVNFWRDLVNTNSQ